MSEIDIWTGIDRLIDRAPNADLTSLASHGVHLLAARRWRAQGRPIPPSLVAAERMAAMRALAVPGILKRVRAAVDGPILLLKGPEVAARYPNPLLRQYGDLDLLLADPMSAQTALPAAGFEVLEDLETPHPKRAMHWPALPQLQIEPHDYPSWLRWLTPPPNSELFAMAVPSATGIEGILTLPAAEHALLLAAHSWGHAPLNRVIDLVDIALMAEGQDGDMMAAMAEEWGLGRVWATTTQVTAALLGDGPGRCWPLDVWARHLRTFRVRSVAEDHLVVWLGAWWAPGSFGRIRILGETIRHDMRPLPDESWSIKLGRIGEAVRDAFEPNIPGTRTRQRRAATHGARR